MKDRVFEAIRKFNMLSDVSSIIVGVSGGADSIALLHFLICLSKQKNIKIIAAHINHGLRGDESIRDENFVRLVCKDWGVKLHVKHADIKNLANKCGQGVEECGRNVRYSFFKDIASKNNSKIATAHTLSDNIETLILNLTRGCGLNGLCGIPPVRENIIRPLILSSRDEIESYCKENNLSFVNDSTNFKLDYTRNKIRLKIIPILKEINPSFDNVCRRFFDNILFDEYYLDDIAEEKLKDVYIDKGFDAYKIKCLPESIMKRVILKILAPVMKKNPTNKDVERIIKLIDGGKNGICISSDYKINVDKGILRFNRINKDKDDMIFWEYEFKAINVLTEIKKTFIINILNSKEYSKLVCEDNNIVYKSINMDNINSEDVVFRNRRPKDRFSPLGRGCTKTVKKLFNELKIPLNKRNNLAMLANGNEIIWIDGVGVSDKFKIKENTKLIAIIKER